jgi:TonB family protein
MDVRHLNIEGDVVVDALIDEHGHITDTKAVSGPKALQKAAMDSVRHWIYKPAILRGQAVSSHVYVTIKFRLK